MPQPTTNIWPFIVKEPPSADGHTGGVVAGVGAVEEDSVGDKLADAGSLGATSAEPLREMLLDELGMPETGAPEEPEVVDAGLGNKLSLELDSGKLFELEVLVLKGAI